MDDIPLPPSPQYSPSQITSSASEFEADDAEEMSTVKTTKPSSPAAISPVAVNTALGRSTTPVVSVLGKDKAKQRLKAFAASKTGGISFGVMNIGKKLIKTGVASKAFPVLDDDDEEEESRESSSHGISTGGNIKDPKSTPKIVKDALGESARKKAAEAIKKINKTLAGSVKDSDLNRSAQEHEGSQKDRHHGNDERERNSKKERRDDADHQDSRRRERRRSEEKRRDRDGSNKRSERTRHSPKREEQSIAEKVGVHTMPKTWKELKPLALSDGDLHALKKELCSSKENKPAKCMKNCVLVKKAASGLEALDPFTLRCERALAAANNRELSAENITDAKYYAEFECPLQSIQRTKTTPSLEWCVRNPSFCLSRDEVLIANSEQAEELQAILNQSTKDAPAESGPPHWSDKKQGEREWFPKEDESLQSRASAPRLSTSKSNTLPVENEKTRSKPSSLRDHETANVKEPGIARDHEEPGVASEQKEKRKRKHAEENVEVESKKKRKKDKSKKKKKKSKDVEYESDGDVANAKKKRKKEKEDSVERKTPTLRQDEGLKPSSERKPLDNKLLSLAGYASGTEVEPVKSSSRRTHHDDTSERRRRGDPSYSADAERKRPDRHLRDRDKFSSKASHEDHVSEARVRSSQQHGPRTPSPFAGEAVASEEGDWRRSQLPANEEWPSSPSRAKAARRRSPSPSPLRRQWRPPSPSRSRPIDVAYSPSPPPGAREAHRRGYSRSPSPPRYGRSHYADPSSSSRPPRWSSHSPSPPPTHRGRPGPPSTRSPRDSSRRRSPLPRHAPREDVRDRDWTQDRGGRGHAPRGSGGHHDFPHLGHVVGAGAKREDSPKRLSLDERLEKELGIKVQNEAQRHMLAAPSGFPIADYSKPPPGYLPTGQPACLPPPNSAAPPPKREAAHQPQDPAPLPDAPEEGRLVRVGNMLQIVPEEGDATPTADEPPAHSLLPSIVPPPPVVASAKPPQEMPTIMKKMEELKKKEEAERLRRRERKLAARLSLEKKAEEQKLEQAAAVENADKGAEAASDETSSAKRILERIEQEEEEDQEAREAKLLQEAISSVPEMDSDEEFKGN